jgi:uncharacterized membrane protein affecting hemolysin expression
MTDSYNRLKRMQQRVWRRAANALLMLNQHVMISLSFLVIIVFGVFWIIFEQELEDHLFNNARNYGHGVAQYASGDLARLLSANTNDEQKAYLERLVNTPLIVSATLYDASGRLLAEADNATTGEPEQHITLLHDINNQETRLGILKITLNRAAQEAPIQSFMNRLAFMAVGLMIIASILAWYVGRLLTRPINRLFSLPLEAPDSEAVESLDVSQEIKDILVRTGEMNKSPAPISEMESSGLHKLLAVDASASRKKIVIVSFYLYDLKKWFEDHTDKDIVRKLREIDQRLLVTTHGQMGIVTHFDGITASACFGMVDDVVNPGYKALSCAMIVQELFAEIHVQVQIKIQEENRIILRHRHRMPLSVPYEEIQQQQPAVANNILIHEPVAPELVATNQVNLVSAEGPWLTLESMSESARSLYTRQKEWTQYLLEEHL